jgi:hypothetical protein
MFLLSRFAKGGGKRTYSNSIDYDHSSTLKTLQEILGVEPLLGAAAPAMRGRKGMKCAGFNQFEQHRLSYGNEREVERRTAAMRQLATQAVQ